MCGKCKYGLGDSRKRRQQWIFGGVSRNTGRMFLSLCPENKRTKKALWPIVQAFVAPLTMLYTDGWRVGCLSWGTAINGWITQRIMWIQMIGTMMVCVFPQTFG